MSNGRLFPNIPEEVPQRNNRFSLALGQGYFRVTGWRVSGNFPQLSKFLIIVAPHTSNWDFPIAITALFATGFRMSWMGKHTFVNGILKPLWHYLDGIPIDRRASHGVVGEMVAQFNKHPDLILGLAPEGTRSQVKRWKMGFYYIARDAHVPICPIVLDYGRKVIRFGEAMTADENIDVVLTQLRDFFRGAVARHPQNFVPIIPD